MKVLILLKDNFSPIFPDASAIVVSIVFPSTSIAFAASKSAGLFAATASHTLFTNATNSAFFATKSVSELTSTIAATFPLIAKADNPSAAILSAFLADFAIPFSLNQSNDASMSPSHASNAFLQSIIPAPVFSRNSFTNFALIAIFFSSMNFILLKRESFAFPSQHIYDFQP